MSSHVQTEVDDDIKFGMIEAISHLIHRDYEAIVADFVTLQFIPKGTDLQPILPVLSKVVLFSGTAMPAEPYKPYGYGYKTSLYKYVVELMLPPLTS